MASLRSATDPVSILLNASVKFDLYAVVEKTALFRTYPKTVEGIVSFFRTELNHNCVRTETPTTVTLRYDKLWVELDTIQFLRLLLLPFYHCTWDAEMQIIVEEVNRCELTERASALSAALSVNPAPQSSGITIDMVPDDWRDLVEGLIRDQKLDIGKYKTVDQLEQYVDGVLFSVPAEEEEVPLAIPGHKLMTEDKEILARTLRLDVSEFNTKEEAFKLFESRR